MLDFLSMKRIEPENMTKEEALLHYKQMELDSLLQVTDAINRNDSSTDLYRIYGFILKAQLRLQRLVIFYNNDENWELAHQYGLEKVPRDQIMMTERWFDHREPVFLDTIPIDPIRQHFDVLMPVYHKDHPLAFVLLGNLENNSPESKDARLKFIQTITNIIIVAIENKRLFRKQLQQERMTKELEVARNVQKMLIPDVLPNNEHLNLSAIYIPHDNIGGDYYDVFHISKQEILACIADVSGKGISAALLMSNFQALIKVLAKENIGLVKLVNKLNERVEEITKGERFITLFLAIYNLETRVFKYINAGHPPPLLFQKGEKEIVELKSGCTLIGAFDQLPKVTEGSITIPPQSNLVMYTDGLSDVVNEADEYFEEKNLYEFILQQNSEDSKALNDLLLAYIDRFKGTRKYTDDISILTWEFN